MHSTILILVTLFAFFEIGLSLTISMNSKQSFPNILPLSNNNNAFVRVKKTELTMLRCPKGFTFDAIKLKCTYRNNYKTDLYLDAVTCPEDYAGTLLNPNNCKTFVDCWYGTGYIMPCAAHLIYNNITGNCDWPEKTKCCEYWENDSSKLVADM